MTKLEAYQAAKNAKRNFLNKVMPCRGYRLRDDGWKRDANIDKYEFEFNAKPTGHVGTYGNSSVSSIRLDDKESRAINLAINVHAEEIISYAAELLDAETRKLADAAREEAEAVLRVMADKEVTR